MKFSKKKFGTLSEESQHSKIIKFIQEIEANWEDQQIRLMNLVNFSEMLSFSEDEYLKEIGIKIFPMMNRRDFLKVIVPLEKKLNIDKRDHEIYIHKLDGERDKKQPLDLTLVLSDLRSAFNVGSIMRTAECFGIKNIYLCGYTPDNEKVMKTAMGTREMLNVRHFESTLSAIEDLKKKNIKIYALETAENAESIYDLDFELPAAIIAGNEALGIEDKILKEVDEIIQIPLSGWKNSLNVGVAAAIAVSEIYKYGKRDR